MRKLRTKSERREVWSLGVRFGYWPCVKGPFIQINFGHYYRSFWFGLPEQKEPCDMCKYLEGMGMDMNQTFCPWCDQDEIDAMMSQCWGDDPR